MTPRQAHDAAFREIRVDLRRLVLMRTDSPCQPTEPPKLFVDRGHPKLSSAQLSHGLAVDSGDCFDITAGGPQRVEWGIWPRRSMP